MEAPRGRRSVSPARQQQRAERQQDVLDAADRLLSRGGLDGLSMRELAREAGIPAPTLYGYFASKDAVIAALAERKLDLLEAAMLREAVTAPPGLPRLIAVARGYRSHAHSGRDYYDLFMLHAAGGPEGPMGAAHERGMGLIRRFEEEIRHAIDLGHVSDMDPEAAIFALWSTVHGFVSLELNGALDALLTGSEDREAMYLQFVEGILRGLGPGNTQTTGG